MRRHLARLVEAGLLMRRDSPNGKRYVRKHGEERVAFGFDLSPLYRRSAEIARAAEAVCEAEDRVRRLREVVSLMRRGLAALAEFGEEISSPALAFGISCATRPPSRPAHFAASFRLRICRAVEPTLKRFLTRRAMSSMALKRKKCTPVMPDPSVTI